MYAGIGSSLPQMTYSKYTKMRVEGEGEGDRWGGEGRREERGQERG